MEDLYRGSSIYSAPTDARFNELSKGFQHVVADLKRLGYERKRVLDLGCDAGYALAAFQEHGWSVVGIELNPATSGYARQKLGVRILSSADQLEPAEKFDVIMLSHVIEHIVEPGELLKSLAARLQSQGVFYIMVPNYGSYYVRHLTRGNWASFIPWQHVWYFDSRSLPRLLRQNGFECLEVKSRNHFSWRSRTWGRTVVKSILAAVSRLIPMNGEEIVGVFRRK
jgi:SAM-dependent methyltransferase